MVLQIVLMMMILYIILQTLSIIASECCMDLEFIDQRARDLFIHRFYLFLQLYTKSTELDGDLNRRTIIERVNSTEEDDPPKASSKDGLKVVDDIVDDPFDLYDASAVDNPPIDYNDRTLVSNPLYRNASREAGGVRRSGRGGRGRDGYNHRNGVDHYRSIGRGRGHVTFDHRSGLGSSNSKQQTEEYSPTLHMHELYAKGNDGKVVETKNSLM